MTHEDILFSIAGGSFAIVVGLVGAILSNFNSRIKITKDTTDGIKSNYLDRFDELKTVMSANHLATIGAINGLEKKMISDFTTKSECYFKHKD